MISNDNLKTVLESIIFDLEGIKQHTKEKCTYNSINKAIGSLNKIINQKEGDTELNFVNRVVYERMIKTKDIDPKTNKELFISYQKLKSGELDPGDVLEILFKTKGDQA